MLLISSQVFHGVESDWMEEEMADDPEFKRDVLEQRIKKIIKDEVRDKFVVLLLWEFPGCFIHFPKKNRKRQNKVRLRSRIQNAADQNHIGGGWWCTDFEIVCRLNWCFFGVLFYTFFSAQGCAKPGHIIEKRVTLLLSRANHAIV